MRLRFPVAALLLPFLVPSVAAQVEAHLGGLTRTHSALRYQRVGCAPINVGCTTNLPATNQPWAGGTGYDATSGHFWVSEGHVLARVNPRGCGFSCGPYPAPTIGNAVVTGLEVLERTNQLLVLDSAGVLNTLSLNGSCNGPQLISTCGTGLGQQGSRVTSGLAADESRGLVFMSYTDFATDANRIAVIHLASGCTPFVATPLPNCGSPFGAVRGLAIDSCSHTLYATDGFRMMRVSYAFQLSTMSMVFSNAVCCPNISTVLDPFVGLALRPNPGVPSGQSCSNGACPPCAMDHSLLTGTVLGNSNLLFHLDGAKNNSWTWLGLGYGPCMNGGPIIYPLCGPVLLGGISAAMPPLVSGPYPVTGGASPCDGSATVVVDFPYAPAFCNSTWSSQFISLCFGATSTAPFGTAMSNCQSWTVISP